MGSGRLADKKAAVKNHLRQYPLVARSYRQTKRLAGAVKRRALPVVRVKGAFSQRGYINYVLNQRLDKSDFVPLTDSPHAGKASKKLIAYYLPQFYQIPQNDIWFGRGFTEWTNCTLATPQFTGHWQPHLPIDVGFYSLETTHAMYRQVELAKMYGIYGFCFYYYWFSGGDKIMEKPLENWLNEPSLDFPFMLFWANEDWTNNWGEQAHIGTKVYSAKVKPHDAEKFVNDILPYFKDKRYITVDGRPHLTIYQAKKDPHLPEFIQKVGELVQAAGIKKPYISLVFPDDFDAGFDPRDFGADAAVEFGSHLPIMPAETPRQTTNKKLLNPLARIKEYEMESFIANETFLAKKRYPVFTGAMTTFDNTARKIYTGAQLFCIPPKLYQRWLTRLVEEARTDQIFIAAWNEWAEGMHLEPDQRYGYAYLQATKDALEAGSHRPKK